MLLNIVIVSWHGWFKGTENNPTDTPLRVSRRMLSETGGKANPRHGQVRSLSKGRGKPGCEVSSLCFWQLFPASATTASAVLVSTRSSLWRTLPSNCTQMNSLKLLLSDVLASTTRRATNQVGIRLGDSESLLFSVSGQRRWTCWGWLKRPWFGKREDR